MSSHYIYVSCLFFNDTASAEIYTGDATTDNFEDSGPDSWEGETITIRCRKCLAGKESDR